jgi:hypothetical protein
MNFLLDNELMTLTFGPGALCGMYGYWEFFKYEWLEKILSLQDPVYGCYRWAGWPEERIGK